MIHEWSQEIIDLQGTWFKVKLSSHWKRFFGGSEVEVGYRILSLWFLSFLFLFVIEYLLDILRWDQLFLELDHIECPIEVYF